MLLRNNRMSCCGVGLVVTQGPDRTSIISNRVFYKELEEGVYKIIDVNMILLV